MLTKTARSASVPALAVVTRDPERNLTDGAYLVMTGEGKVMWTDDPCLATAFASMREATRAALRLPASVRAYGMPRDVEIHARPTLH